MEMWGDEDGDRIVVVYSKQDIVEEIIFRLDVRKVSESFIMSIIAFLDELDCLIVTETGSVIDPKAGRTGGANFFFSLMNQINESNPKKFVDNPEDFLRGL